MATTLAYACDFCGKPCQQDIIDTPERVYCMGCEVGWKFAPWSYCELIGAIGLEAAHTIDNRALTMQRKPIVSKSQWARMLRMQLIDQGQFIIMLQQGVRTTAEVGLAASAPEQFARDKKLTVISH